MNPLTSSLLFLGRYKNLYSRQHKCSGPYLMYFHDSCCFSFSCICVVFTSMIDLLFPFLLLWSDFLPLQCNAKFGARRVQVRRRCTSLSPGSGSARLWLGFSPECVHILLSGVIPACTCSLNFFWLFA